MSAITEHEFEKLCADVAADAKEILMAELFRRVCQHLELDPNIQKSELPGKYTFVVSKTVEDYMEPGFNYPEVLHAHLLPALRK